MTCPDCNGKPYTYVADATGIYRMKVCKRCRGLPVVYCRDGKCASQDKPKTEKAKA